jgi:hypothetical protein
MLCGNSVTYVLRFRFRETRRVERNLSVEKILDGGSMSLYESSTHSFIVKIWLEERTDEAEPLTWRGHITHVPSGKRHYLRSLDEMTDFISVFLKGMGIRLGKRWQVKQWLRRKGTTRQH